MTASASISARARQRWNERGHLDDTLDLTPELAEAASRFRIADCHCHIYPSKIAAKASDAVGVFYELPMYAKVGDADTLVANGSQIGVERYLVCSVATTLPQVDSIGRFIQAECAAHPEFIGLGAWHEDVEDVDALLDTVAERGLLGIKIHPDFQKVSLDDPRMLKLFAAIAERGMRIMIHMGDPRYEFSAPAKLARVLERYDTLKVDAAHFGGWGEWDNAVPALAGSPAYYDLSSSLGFLEPEDTLALIDAYGADKIMFGVDFPMWNHVAEFSRVLALGLDDATLQDIFYNNFARFYLDE